MKYKTLSIVLLLCFVVSLFSSCSLKKDTIQSTISSNTSSVLISSLDSSCASLSDPVSIQEFDIDAYKQQVYAFAVSVSSNVIPVSNVCIYGGNYLSSLQKIAGSSARVDDLPGKCYSWLEENSDYTKDSVDAANIEIESMYKDLILVEFEGKEAEEIDSAVRDMYQSYKSLYDLSNLNTSVSGLLSYSNTCSSSYSSYLTAWDTLSLFIDLPDDE